MQFDTVHLTFILDNQTMTRAQCGELGAILVCRTIYIICRKLFQWTSRRWSYLNRSWSHGRKLAWRVRTLEVLLIVLFTVVMLHYLRSTICFNYFRYAKHATQDEKKIEYPCHCKWAYSLQNTFNDTPHIFYLPGPSWKSSRTKTSFNKKTYIFYSVLLPQLHLTENYVDRREIQFHFLAKFELFLPLSEIILCM